MKFAYKITVLTILLISFSCSNNESEKIENRWLIEDLVFENGAGPKDHNKVAVNYKGK